MDVSVTSQFWVDHMFIFEVAQYILGFQFLVNVETQFAAASYQFHLAVSSTQDFLFFTCRLLDQFLWSGNGLQRDQNLVSLLNQQIFDQSMASFRRALLVVKSYNLKGMSK